MEHSVCFIGHRKISDTPELRERLLSILSELIKSGTVNFIFGDHSEFIDLCYNTVTRLKEKYPAIRRIKFRKDYGDTDSYKMKFIMCGYEESYCPSGVDRAGRASYVERNQAMIEESDVCVFYYDKNYRPERRKNRCSEICDRRSESGTAIAFKFAVKRNKTIINCFYSKTPNI